MIEYESKLPPTGTSIFAIMSNLAREHSAINLGQGFPDYPISNKLKSYVAHYLNDGKNQYAPMPGLLSLRERISQKYHSAYHRQISADKEVTIHAGATQAIFMTIAAFVKKDDEVIIIEPAYDCYLPTISMMGAKPFAVTVREPSYKVDWNELADCMTEKTRMIIVNNPHNPIGTTFDKSDMLSLQDIVKDKNIIVLSDEVYEHLVYDGVMHQSVLAYPQLAEQSVAIYSFGKTFHATGWKMGYSIASAHLMNEIRNVHQWNVFSVNSFIQYALTDFLEDPEEYNKLSSFFQYKRDLLQDALSDTSLMPLACTGTYFQLYDYSSISDLSDIEFAHWLVREYGVATIPISPFYKDKEADKVVRFCFAKEDATLLRAAEKLRKL